MLKAGMNEIITAPDLSLGENQILKSKEMFIEEMQKAINNEFVRDPFFNRPDCIAELIWKLHENPISLMDDPLINGLLNYLIQTINMTECDFEWCNRDRRTLPEDCSEYFEEESNKYQNQLQISDSFLTVTNHLSIKKIAKILLEYGEDNFGWHDSYKFEYELMIKLFLFRLMEVEPDTYYSEGWI